MNKKWLLKLSGSLLAALLITGCQADDQDPAPPGTEEDGTVTDEPADENMGGEDGQGTVDEMTPDLDDTTPADETTPGTTEEGEGTPGEGDEGVTEDPEANMGEGTEGNGTDAGTETGEDEENK